MQLFIEKVNELTAKDILNWHYDKPYDFYNNELTGEEMKEMLNGSYYVLVNTEKEIFGFFCIGESAQVPVGKQFGAYTDDFVDMGLGMNPKFTGKGNGFAFCSFILRYIDENFKDTPIRLTVAKFNKRAIHLYEKLGFVMKSEFRTDLTEFITMVKK